MSEDIAEELFDKWILAAIAIAIALVMIPSFVCVIVRHFKTKLSHPSYYVWWMILFKLVILFVVLFQALQHLMFSFGVFNEKDPYYRIANNITCVYTGEVVSAFYMMYLWWMAFMVIHTIMLYTTPYTSFIYNYKPFEFILSGIWAVTYAVFLLEFGKDASMYTLVGLCNSYTDGRGTLPWQSFTVITCLRFIPRVLFYLASLLTFVQCFLISRLPINTGHKIRELSIIVAVFLLYSMFEDAQVLYRAMMPMAQNKGKFNLFDDIYFIFFYLSFVLDYILWRYSEKKTDQSHSQHVEIEEQQLLINKPSTNMALDKEFYGNIVTFTLMGILDTLTYDVEPHLLPHERTLKISQTSMTFTDYNPFEIRHLRRNVWNIYDEEYKCSFQPPSDHVYNRREEHSLFTTHDGRYTVYMATKVKFDFLLNMINSYYRYSCSNPESLISRIAGLHKVKMLPLHDGINLVVLENVSARAFSRSLNNTVLTNLINVEQLTGPGVPLHPEHTEKLLDVLEKDIMFLRDNNVVQYTVKVSIEAMGETDSTMAFYSLREGLPNADRYTGVTNGFHSMPQETQRECSVDSVNNEYNTMQPSIDTRTYVSVECFLNRWDMVDKIRYSIRQKMCGNEGNLIKKLVPPEIYADQMFDIVKRYFQ